MFGHGCPTHGWIVRLAMVVSLLGGGIAIAPGARATFAQNPPPAIEPSRPIPIRLNMSWGTDEPRRWSGEIRVESGFFWNSVPLGADRNASVTFRFSEENSGRLPFATPEPVPFCGLQTTVVAPRDASVTVSLLAEGADAPLTRTFMAGESLAGPISIPFDAKGNALVVERAAGDEIPLTVWRIGEYPGAGKNRPSLRPPSMVFSEGETLIVGVFTHYLPAGGGGNDSTRRLKISLRSAGREEPIWADGIDLTDRLLAEQPRLDIPIPLRNFDGPFDVILELVQNVPEKNRWSILPAGRETPPAILAKRVFQGVVVPNRSAQPRGTFSDAERLAFNFRGELLETVDPTNPTWWKNFSRRPAVAENLIPPLANLPNPLSTEFLNLRRFGTWQSGLQNRLTALTGGIPWGQRTRFWQQSLSSGHLTRVDSTDPRRNSFVELAPSHDPAITPWEAYTLPILEPGKPHLLEIEYLPDHPQRLGVSLLEPSASGGLFPRSLDNGIFVPEEPLSDQVPHRVLRYQILFWPKTKTPTILLTNSSPDHSAIYGRIRIYRAKDRFVPLVSPEKGRGGRSFAAVMSRPVFCEQFLAAFQASPVGVGGAPDWKTFWDGSLRMTETLLATGYDTLFLSVMADGSAIWPAASFRPGTEYDAGIFLSRGEDPVRKDVPELLLRLFDTDGMTLVPTLDFNAPLPVVEEAIFAAAMSVKETGEEGSTDEFFLLRADGTPVVCRGDKNDPRTARLYNLLHPTVQKAILDVVADLADRYAPHPSFGGVAIELSDSGFAHLPSDIYTGLDDETIRRFVAETRLAERIPDSLRAEFSEFLATDSPDRFRHRAIFLHQHVRKLWVAWRAGVIHRFYAEMSKTLRARRPDTLLYLAPTDGFTSTDSREPFAAARSCVATHAETFLNAGFDLERFGQTAGLVLFRPESAPSGMTSDTASGETVRLFATNGVVPGAIFSNEPAAKNLPSFDAASPFHPTVTQIVPRVIPADFQNRKRFARQLAACDTLRLADGGRMIPMGEEESLREWIATWRALPNRPFSDGATPTDSAVFLPPSDPVVFRTLRTGDEFWGYLVNSAPFHCGVDLGVACEPGANSTIFVGGRAVSRPEMSGGEFRWSISLRPYDLVAFKITDPNAMPRTLTVTPPDTLTARGGRIDMELAAAADRIALAAAGIPLALSNAGFEEIASPILPLSVSTTAEPDPKKSLPLLGLDIPKVKLLRNPFAGGNSGSTEPVSTLPLGAETLVEASATPGTIPGWERWGDSRLLLSTDPSERIEGAASLRMIHSGSAGGIISAPFAAPTSGRLFVRCAFGISTGTPTLPLQVSLTGRVGGAAWQRQILIGPTLLTRLKNQNNVTPSEGLVGGVEWVREVLVFENLPTGVLDEVALRFDWLGPGEIRLDDIQIYKTALTRTEFEGLTASSSAAQHARNEGRIGPALDFLAEPAIARLTTEIPNDSPAWVNRPKREVPPFDEKTPPQMAQNPSSTEKTLDNTLPSELASKKKNFLQRILPW